MYIKYREEEIECVTTLRTAMNIQKKFRKPYMQILKQIEDLDLEEQLKILYAGIELGKIVILNLKSLRNISWIT